MAKSDQSTRRPPATTPEGRDQQMTALAIDAIEKRIRNGTASAQELTQMAARSSPKAKLELKILEQQYQLLAAKTAAIKAQAQSDETYKNALAAMQMYSGHPERVVDYDD